MGFTNVLNAGGLKDMGKLLGLAGNVEHGPGAALPGALRLLCSRPAGRHLSRARAAQQMDRCCPCTEDDAPLDPTPLQQRCGVRRLKNLLDFRFLIIVIGGIGFSGWT